MKSSRTGPLLWLALLAAIVLVVIALPDSKKPYDLDSSRPDGYLALRLIIEELGGSVGTADATDITADSLSESRTVYVPVAQNASPDVVDRWRTFVEAGGQLVLGTPVDGLGAQPLDSFDDEAAFAPGPFGGVVSARPGDCTIPELEDAVSIDVSILTADLDVSELDSCFGDGSFAFVGRERIGEGTVTTFGSPDLVTNELLGAPMPEDEDNGGTPAVPDNALLVARIISIDPQHDVAVVTSGVSTALGGDGKSVVDFISPGIQLGILELGVAMALYAWFRARREVPLYVESDPVEVDASDLTRAVGSLLERQGDAGRAATALRFQTHRDLTTALGLPTDTSVETLAQIVSTRTGQPIDFVQRTLVDTGGQDDRSLVALSSDLDLIRQEATT